MGGRNLNDALMVLLVILPCITGQITVYVCYALSFLQSQCPLPLSVHGSPVKDKAIPFAFLTATMTAALILVMWAWRRSGHRRGRDVEA